MTHACRLICTLEGIEGLSCIFYCKGGQWKINNTFYQAFMKGFTWLEAYQAHLRTEKSIRSGNDAKIHASVYIVSEQSPVPQGQIYKETDCPYPLSKHINRRIEV